MKELQKRKKGAKNAEKKSAEKSTENAEKKSTKSNKKPRNYAAAASSKALFKFKVNDLVFYLRA